MSIPRVTPRASFTATSDQWISYTILIQYRELMWAFFGFCAFYPSCFASWNSITTLFLLFLSFLQRIKAEQSAVHNASEKVGYDCRWVRSLIPPSNSHATSERIPVSFFTIGLLVWLIEQARVVFVRLKCYSRSYQPSTFGRQASSYSFSLPASFLFSNQMMISRGRDCRYIWENIDGERTATLHSKFSLIFLII